MTKPQSLLEREALRAVDVERRRAWFAERYARTSEPCSQDDCANRTACPNPSHWNRPGVRPAALADLVDPRDVVDKEESAAAGIDTTAAIEDKATAGPAVDAGADLARAITAAVAAVMAQSKPGLDRDAVKAICEDVYAEHNAPRHLSVKVNDRAAVNVGLTHRTFPRLLRMVAAGVNVWLAGPAGSGKTTAAAQVAKALDLPFYFNGAIDTEYKLSGFVDAGGRIVSTAFRKAFTDGGVYLFDEADASLPPALLAFNAALANGHADFPGSDTPIPRSERFYCMAGANTFGLGGTSDYVGRNRLDAAFLDRFSFLLWDYDESLERALAGNDSWTAYVQEKRAAAKARGLRVVISPRASIRGAMLLAAGLSRDDVIDCEIRSKMTPEQWSALSGGR